MLLLDWAYILEHVEGGQNLVEVEEMIEVSISQRGVPFCI